MSNVLLIYLFNIAGLLTAFSNVYIMNNWPYVKVLVTIFTLILFFSACMILIRSWRKRWLKSTEAIGHSVVTLLFLFAAIGFNFAGLTY